MAPPVDYGGSRGLRPSRQLLGVRFAAVMREPAWDPPSYWVSPKPASGLMSPKSTDGVARAGPLYAVKAISLALDMPADPRCMEPDRTRGDRCVTLVQVVAEDPEGVVGHDDGPVLGVGGARVMKPRRQRQRNLARSRRTATGR